MVAWVFAATIEGGDLASYLLPSPLILVVGGSLAGQLIAYGESGVGALPGLFGLAPRGPINRPLKPQLQQQPQRRPGRPHHFLNCLC